MCNTQTARDDARDRRVGQVLDEYLARRARGQAEPEAELLAEHPDLADELRSHLELIRHLRPDRSDLESLLAQGILEPCQDSRYPARLGEYKIRRFIGRGGMGVVLEAYEESLDRRVALKVLRPELGEDQSAVARFTREARAAAALRHPNIVTIHAVRQQRGVHYLAMEYIEGPTLADLIRQGWPADRVAAGAPAGQPPQPTESLPQPLPTEFIRYVFRQLLSALAAAHEAGLIHRDVKSSNILLELGTRTWEVGGQKSERGTRMSGVGSRKCEAGTENDEAGTSGPGDERDPPSRVPSSALGAPSSELRTPSSAFRVPHSAFVKLADFGLARMLSARTRMTMTGSVMGTPEYMSPEQARGDEKLDHRTDLYSAGVVLYEMLTGRTPFKADTPSAVIHRIINDEPTDPRRINRNANPHLTTLALRLMAKRCEDRFNSATDAIAALDASDHVVLFDKRRRRRRHWTLGTTLVVALLVGVAWLQSVQMITAVKVDDHDRARLLVRRGFSSNLEEFHRFPEGVRATSAKLVDVDGRGRTLVFAALEKATGRNLVAITAEGKEVLGWYLSSDDQWPDCQISQVWGCYALAASNLDGDSGDEVVVVASDEHDYPTLISIIDPRLQEIRSSFRHMGDITGVRLEPNFFENGGTAIIAWGANNKLDGFDAYPGGPEQRLPGDDTPVTEWDYVSVVMILDPATMEGLGPPRTNRLPGVPSARLHAYAFLGLAHVEAAHSRPPGARERIPPKVEQIASIRNVRRTAAPDEDIANLQFEVIVVREDGSDGAYILVDRNLNVRGVKVTNAELHGRTPAYWRQRWHPIIQHGKYVNEDAGRID